MRRMLMSGMEENDVKEWKLIGKMESDGLGDAVGLYVQVDFSQYTEIFVVATMTEKSKNRRIVLGNLLQWHNGSTCAILPGTNEQVFMLATRADIIDGVIYPYCCFNSGYNNVNDNPSKNYVPMFSPRENLNVDSIKYVRYDTNNNGAIPTGEVLKVFAR